MATAAQINAIVGLYVAYFDRAPDPAGLQFWIDQLDNGRDFSTISQDFADSAEAQAIYPYLSDDNDLGTISPIAFITNIYANLFGRVPDQAGLEFWTGVLESGSVAPGDMVEAISLGAVDNLNGNGFFDRSVLDNKIECARYFTEQAGEIGTFPQGGEEGQFEIGSPEYLAAVGAVGAAGNQMDNMEECQNFIDSLLREFVPNSSFTLCPVKVFVESESETDTPVTEKVLYWGFANTLGTDTAGDNADNPGENVGGQGGDGTSVISNGIPADAFFGPGGYFQTLAMQEFAGLDVIDTDMDQFSIIDWSSVTDISVTVNNTTGGDSGNNDIGGVDGGVLTVTYPDGSTDDIALGQRYFDFLCKLILDDDGNSRFYEQEVVVGLPVYINAEGEFTTKPQPGQEPVGTIDRGLIEVTDTGKYEISWDTPLVLTPTENNGGTKEAGFTSDDNDFIQVGIVDLLHGAIIDGGGGYNTLEIDGKGHFAQPKSLHNIQQISIQNLPNIYTTGEDNGNQYPDVVVGDEDGITTAGASALSDDEGDIDTIIDLSRATDLENLTVTEGSYLGLDTSMDRGDLNVVGVRNDATLTLQGAFTQRLYVQTSEGNTGDGFTVILDNVNSEGSLFISSNSPKLNLVSNGGGNYIRELNEKEEFDIHGNVLDLVISGSAALTIEEDLNGIFDEDFPITIDASENTGGVDLSFTGAEIVTFIGSAGDDRLAVSTMNDAVSGTAGVDFIEDSEITITNAEGDNYYDLSTNKLTLTDGSGDIQLEALAGGADVTLGGGDNTVALQLTELDLTVGDGDNVIDINQLSPSTTLINKDLFDNEITITAGDGENKICVAAGTLEDSDVTITAGDGGNTIEVDAENITVTTGAGDDTITVTGSTKADDYVSNGAVLKIEAGAGTNTVVLGTDVPGANNSVTETGLIAKAGSFISGENLTLVVENKSDLRAADISDVDSVILNHDISSTITDSDGAVDRTYETNPSLTLTDTQFLEIGAANFSVMGAEFSQYTQIEIIVTQSGKLADLGVAALPNGVDVVLNIQDGVQLEIDAELLHTKVAPMGVILPVDNNTDEISGSVYITGAGLNFDPFNSTDKVRTDIEGQSYFGGSLFVDDFSSSPDKAVQRDEWGSNVLIDRVFGGYDRPVDAPSYSRLTIDTDTLTADLGPFSTLETFLRIIGDSDMTFTPVKAGRDDWGRPIQGGDAITLGADRDGLVSNVQPFIIDFSQATGTISNLTFANFQEVVEIYGNGTALSPVRVNAELTGNLGSADEGLDSHGVQTYVVTDIDVVATDLTPNDNTDDNFRELVAFWTCETTEDLETLGLRGNYGATITFGNTERGVDFLMEVAYDKQDGYSVGELIGAYARPGADAVVNIVDVDTLPAGEVQLVEGLQLINAATVTLNIEGGATVIEAMEAVGATALDINSADAVTIKGDLPSDLSVIDASDVAGLFTATIDGVTLTGDQDETRDGPFTFTGGDGGSVLFLEELTPAEENVIDGGTGGATLVVGGAGNNVDVDLSLSTLSNILGIELKDEANLWISMADADAIGASNFSLYEGADEASLNLAGLNDEVFAVANYAEGIDVALLSIAAEPVVTLNAATDLTDIGGLVVPEGTVLNLTAAQYQQLDNAGSIVGEMVSDGSGGLVPTTDFTVNITDLTQADVDNGFDITGILADTVTVGLAESIEMPSTAGFTTASTPTVDLTITLGDDMTLAVNTFAEMDGVQVLGGANSILKFLDNAIANDGSDSIDASRFGISEVQFLNVIANDINVDQDLFVNIPSDVEKVVYNGEGTATAVTQTASIEAGTSTEGGLVFNKSGADQDTIEISEFTLNLEGGVEINGSVEFPTTPKNNDVNNEDLLSFGLRSLVINSTGTDANLLTNETANIIDGVITPGGGASGSGVINNTLLNVTVNASQAFQVDGIEFSSWGTGALQSLADYEDGWDINNNESAQATVTITGDADVALGTLDTSDTDVDGLTVNNTGTGTVSATVTANTATLTFSGSNIELTVDGTVDLSDDDLSAVTQLTIANNGIATLSQAQVDALGAANIVVADTASATLNINAFGDDPFDATTFDAQLDIHTITMASGDHTLDGNFTDVDQIVVQEGDTLTLTAAQYQQLLGVSGSKIVSFDTNGDNTAAPITVNITGLTQADIDAGVFDSTLIAANNTVTLSLAEDVVLKGSSSADNLENIDTLIMADGQTLGLATNDQADDLVIDGGANTTVNLLFDISGEIDAAGYDITTLRALATSVDGEDVEVLIDDLPNSVTLNLYESSTEVGFVSDIHRVVVIEPGVQVPSGDVIFNGEDPTREMRTLDITFQGDASDPLTDGNDNIFGAVINGDLVLDVQPQPSSGTPLLIADLFDTLTLISEGVGSSNAITGNISPLAADGLDASGDNVDNTLLNVVIEAESAFTIGGTVKFNTEDAAQGTATLSVSGPAPVSIGVLDLITGVSGDPQIDTLVVNNDGGTLTITGASPSIDAGNAETIDFNGDGDIVLGTAEAVDDLADGITGGNLSFVDAAGLTGDLSIENISGVDSNFFNFTAGTGVTNVTIAGQTLNDDGNAATASGWTLNFSNAGVGSTLTFDDIPAGPTGNTYTSGALNIDLGANTTLIINDDTDLTAMNLSINQTQDIVLGAGVTLTLTAEQADGLNIVGPASATVNVTELGTAAYDLSGISADVAGTTTLATDDVTLDAATNLGDFSVTLVDSDSTAAPLLGQTIRFRDETQAARKIIISDDGNAANLTDTGTGVDTNVVWLFDTITGSVETMDYDPNLGRLWVTPELLANNNNVEELFTTLPDSIVRVEFSSLEELNFALSSADVDRVFEMVAFTDLSATGLVFSDEDRFEHIHTLNIKMGGEVKTGDIALDNIIAPSTNPLELDPTGINFAGLVIESHLVTDDTHFLAPDGFVNNGNGTNEPGEFALPAAINTVGDIGVGPDNGVDFLWITLDTLASSTGASLVGGTITFDSEVAGSTAEVFVKGANDVTVKSLDTSDTDVTTLTIDMTAFTGTFTVTGGSPAAAVVNTETLNIDTDTGAEAVFGTALDLTGEPFAGVAGDELSNIAVTGAGTVDLGVIAQIDSSNDGAVPAFTLDGNGPAGTTAVIGTANVDGVLTAPTLDAGSTWNFLNATLTFSEDVTLGAGTVNFDNVAITVDGDVDFTTLAELTVDNTDVTINVPAGSSVTILAEDADGLTITGGGVVNIANLEDTPAADLSKIMTDVDDTGTVEAALDSTGDVQLTGELGIAHVTISGNGTVTVDTLDTMDDSTFTVGVDATLSLHADQADGRDVDGDGTTIIEDIGAGNYAGLNDVDYSTVVSATVNIEVETDVTLDSADDLGEAGAGRTVLIGDGNVLTSAGSVIDGQFIEGLNATLLVDDENDGATPTDTPITADLSNVSAQFIELVADAAVGPITFPALYGDPAAIPAEAVQTVTLESDQADGQVIVGLTPGVTGAVLVNIDDTVDGEPDGDVDAFDLSAIFTGTMIATIDDTVDHTVVFDTAVNFGGFDIVVTAGDTVTMTAAQATGRGITETGAAAINVTDLEDTLDADLSDVDLTTEIAFLDADANPTFTGDLGAGFTVNVSDDAGAPGTLTVAETAGMVSDQTTFNLEDGVTMVLDANDAHQLTVNDVDDNATVIVNNVDGDPMDLSSIGLNTNTTLTANVPADATLDAATDFADFDVVLAEGVELTLTFDQFLGAGDGDGAGLGAGDLRANDFSGTAGGVEESLVVTGFDPTVQIDTSVLVPDVSVVLQVDAGLSSGDPLNPAQVILDPATDLTGVEEIVVPAGVELVMTASQFQQIQTSTTVSGAGVLTLTEFGNDPVDNGAIDLSSVTANAGDIFLDATEGNTAIVGGQLTGTPIIVDPTAILDNATGAKFSIVMTADDQGLTLSSESQADGRSVTEDAGGFADTRLILGFDSPDAADADVNLVATDYAIDNVFVINTYLDNQFGGITPANIEEFLEDLDSSINVVIYDNDDALSGGLVSPTVVEGTDRIVRVESNTFVDASVAFNDLRSGTEVRTLQLFLDGNAVIDGNLTLPQDEDPNAGLPTSYVDLFETLTITSQDLTSAPLTSPNVIDGNIIGNTALGGAESEVEIFTLTLDPTMSIVGSQEEISFDGAVIQLDDGDTATDVATAIAAAGFQNYRAVASGNVVTFTNITAGDVTDAALADFQFTNNDPGTTGFPGTSAVAVTQQGSFEASENNLLDVEINADHDLEITGVLEFSYVSGTDSILNNIVDETAEANLTINVAAGVNVTIGSVDTSDAHITALNYTKTGTGTVTAPGTSPGAAVGNTETFNIVHEGDTTFGTAGDLDKPGVAGADLSLIDIDGSGTIDFNEIALVDGQAFELNTVDFTGTVSGALHADLEDGGSWLFDNSGAGTLSLTIEGSAAVDAYPADAVYGASFGAGALEFNNVDLVLEGTVDWTNLTSLTITGGSITVAAGATLRLTVAQAEALTGDIVGNGTIEIVGDGTDAVAADVGMHLKTAAVSFATVTLDLLTDADGVFAVDMVGGLDAPGGTAIGQEVTGSDNDDVITTVNAEDDTLLGGLGNDSLTAGGGDDSVLGEAGDDTIVGGDNNGVVDGGADTDTLEVTADYAPAADANLEGVENVTVTAVGGTDVNLANQAGEAFNVTLSNGGDTVVTADGNDTITGGTGDDSVNSGEGDDTIDGGDGADSVVAGLGQDTIRGASNDALLDGGDDTVAGDSTADVLVVGPVFDDLMGDAGLRNIEIVNGEGADTVTGVNIDLDAQTEGFVINGTDDDNDGLTTAEGADTIVSGAGNDTINAGTGDDDITSGAGDDEVNAGDGDDIVSSTSGANTLDGGDGADSITGGTDGETITGGIGNDTITGGAGADSILAGDDDDLLVFATAVELAADVTVDGGNGTDTVQVLGTTLVDADFTDVINVENLDFAGDTAHSATLGVETNQAFANGMTVTVSGDAGAATLDLQGAASTVAIDATGTGQGDTLIGGSADDDLDGGAGADTIVGNGGVDTLSGGDGDDTIVGGAEDALLDGGVGAADVLQVGASFNDASDAQIDGIEQVELTVNTGSSLNLGDQTEGFTITGTDDDNDTLTATNGQDTIVGSQGDDTISGLSGDDSLDGGLGNDSLLGGEDDDTLIGGQGDDTLTGGSGLDTFVFVSDAIAETDTITDFGEDIGGDVLSGELGAGDQLNVSLASVSGSSNGGAPSVITAGVAGSDGVINFEDQYDVGDRITITVGGLAITRTVVAGATSGFDVAEDFEDVMDSLDLNATDADLQNAGAANSSVTTLGVSGGQLTIVNDGGGDNAFTLTSSIDEANGVLFNAYQAGTGIAQTNGVVNVTGGDNDDTITGGVNDDTIDGALGADSINGQAGADSIDGGVGADSIEGGLGNDTLNGGADNDTIEGGADNDIITGGAGADQLDGGAGADDFVYVALSDSSVADGDLSNMDVIIGFDAAAADTLDLSALFTTSGADVFTSASGAASEASILTDLNTLAAAATDGDQDSFLLDITGGDLIGRDFFAADTDDDGNLDIVIEVTGYTGTFDINDVLF